MNGLEGRGGCRFLLVSCLLAVLAAFTGGCVAAFYRPPVAIATAEPRRGDAPLTVIFNGLSSYAPRGRIVSYEWDFGDGSGGSGPIVSHTYTRAGDFTATLKVTDDQGLEGIDTVSIQVVGPPPPALRAVIDADPASGFAPLKVQFDAMASSGDIISYRWDFGDGTGGRGRTVTHVYNDVGDFLVRLTVTDSNGNQDAAERLISVGGVVESLPSPGPHPGGLAFDGRYLLNLDVTKKRIYKLDPATGSVVGSFDLAGIAPEPKGLAWDGEYLWLADAALGKILKLGLAEGRVVEVSSFGAPGPSPMGLEIGGAFLWNTDLNNRRLYKIDPKSGRVIGSFPSPLGGKPYMLAWDGAYLWNETVLDDGEEVLVKLDPWTGEIADLLYRPGMGMRFQGLTWDGTHLWASVGAELVKIELPSLP